MNKKKILILAVVVWCISLVFMILNGGPSETVSFYVFLIVSIIPFYYGAFIILKKLYKKLSNFAEDEASKEMKNRKTYHAGILIKKGFIAGLEKINAKEIYIFALIVIILFPPLSNYYTTREAFIGWNFISNLGGTTQIKMSYLILEIALITTIFLLFRKKK